MLKINYIKLPIIFNNRKLKKIETMFLNFVLDQGQRELNPPRGALETPALPLSYGPKKYLLKQ